MYPEPTSAATSTSSSKLNQAQKASQGSDESSSGESEDESTEASPVLGRAPSAQSDDSKSQSTSTSGPTNRGTAKRQSRQSLNQARAVPNLSSHTEEKSMSPSTTDDSSIPSTSRSASVSFNQPGTHSSVSTNTSQGPSRWSHLSADKQFYLNFHQNYINYHHYFFKHDASHFTHSLLLDAALEYRPLLYAVVGFAAYQVTVRKRNGKIEDFLPYYHNSVSALRKSLSASQKHTDHTILTILQLAAIEVQNDPVCSTCTSKLNRQ